MCATPPLASDTGEGRRRHREALPPAASRAWPPLRPLHGKGATWAASGCRSFSTIQLWGHLASPSPLPPTIYTHTLMHFRNCQVITTASSSLLYSTTLCRSNLCSFCCFCRSRALTGTMLARACNPFLTSHVLAHSLANLHAVGVSEGMS